MKKSFFKKTDNLKLVFLFVLCWMFMTVPSAATLEGLQVGMEAPDFSLKSLEGDTKAFGDLKAEKLTMIVFWASWSPRAEKEIKRIQSLYEKYKDQGLSIIGINVESQAMAEQDIANVKAMVEKYKLSFPILIDYGLHTFHEYGIIAIPTTVILDPKRTIKYELTSYPLIGAEEMVDYVSASIEGRDLSPKVVEKVGYQPDKKVMRMWNMGNTAQRSKRMADTAEMWYQKAIKADPKFVAPHISLAEFYMKRDKADLAKEQYEQAVAKDPKNVVALCELALMLIEEGKVEEGKALLTKGMEAEESFVPCYYYLGYAHGKEGNLEEALKMFDEAASHNPMDYNIYVYKAKVFEDNSKSKEAVDSYKKAVQLILK